MVDITIHTLVKNEDLWIWYALTAWEPYASKIMVYDDSSTDQTKERIEEVQSSKLDYQKVQSKNPADLTLFRQEMKDQTKTSWFVLVDGDEIWNRKTIEKFINALDRVGPDVSMVALHTRNCIGDIYHYLPESAGKYEILGRRGNFNVRAFRNMQPYRWFGVYPLEYYGNNQGVDLLKDSRNVALIDDFYWHMTYLPRSSETSHVFGNRHTKHELGLNIKTRTEFPEVFSLPRPLGVFDPWKKRSPIQTLFSFALTPAKLLKRKFGK
jgi:glycosyltransferase involved in cell wall biosynthesis